MKKPVPRCWDHPILDRCPTTCNRRPRSRPSAQTGDSLARQELWYGLLAIDPAVLPTLSSNEGSAREVNPSEIKDLIAKLEVPFPTSVIESRVSNTTKDSLPRGQVTLYADQRTFTDLEHQMVDQHKAIDLVSPQELRSIFPAPFSPTRPRFGK